MYCSSVGRAHSGQRLSRRCQQVLLASSCTNSLSCSSLCVFNGGSLLLFSCLMGFSLLNPSDEADRSIQTPPLQSTLCSQDAIPCQPLMMENDVPSMALCSRCAHTTFLATSVPRSKCAAPQFEVLFPQSLPCFLNHLQTLTFHDAVLLGPHRAMSLPFL